jgi:hypothetical protein
VLAEKPAKRSWRQAGDVGHVVERNLGVVLLQNVGKDTFQPSVVVRALGLHVSRYRQHFPVGLCRQFIQYMQKR